ncbi:hypothetical protein D9K79_03010 [Acinetobacter cumulans]|uniref:Uncharacterized protein n=1 Tax=Acinetobacter cumulans TaxID=2136182 RepID=A0A498D3F9_9GAMM|nr:hypothetical protein DYI81_04545 [Acinetobacter sp. SWAC5]RLL38843.1 hypothetical protein D9K80_01520 [Acinetobacter cumulans]RLL49292.1 hypothetical protein D9K79_03010 [Acinetobacter cumulans]
MVLSQYKFRSIAAQKIHPKSIPRGGMDAADKLRYRDIPSAYRKIFVTFDLSKVRLHLRVSSYP